MPGRSKPLCPPPRPGALHGFSSGRRQPDPGQPQPRCCERSNHPPADTQGCRPCPTQRGSPLQRGEGRPRRPTPTAPAVAAPGRASLALDHRPQRGAADPERHRDIAPRPYQAAPMVPTRPASLARQVASPGSLCGRPACLRSDPGSSRGLSEGVAAPEGQRRRNPREDRKDARAKDQPPAGAQDGTSLSDPTLRAEAQAWPRQRPGCARDPSPLASHRPRWPGRQGPARRRGSHRSQPSRHGIARRTGNQPNDAPSPGTHIPTSRPPVSQGPWHGESVSSLS